MIKKSIATMNWIRPVVRINVDTMRSIHMIKNEDKDDDNDWVGGNCDHDVVVEEMIKIVSIVHLVGKR